MTEAPPPPSGDDSSAGSTPPPAAPTTPPAAPTPATPSASETGGYPPPSADSGSGTPPQQAYGSPPAYGYGQPAYGGQPAAPAAPYAEWVQRVLATLIDGGIVLAGYIVIFIVAVIFGKIADGLGAFVAIVGYLAVIAFVIWNTILVQGNTGQSIGKKQIGISLIGEQSGQPLGPGLTFVRQIAHVLDSICFIGYLWPLWDPKKQTFADKIMSSIVIKL